MGKKDTFLLKNVASIFKKESGMARKTKENILTIDQINKIKKDMDFTMRESLLRRQNMKDSIIDLSTENYYVHLIRDTKTCRISRMGQRVHDEISLDVSETLLDLADVRRARERLDHNEYERFLSTFFL